MISVHIITGFLGVGKTTLVQQLISQKPENEAWAIIVNEFGELGVDALLLDGSSVTIKQVPGGCACCAANLPFQVSLNQLLKSQSLDRIIIEPSGLGHGDKLAELLEQEQYKDWLTLDSVITLIDPKQFNQAKYREHEIYIRQLQVADGIVISKSDLASPSEIDDVNEWAQISKLPVICSERGNISLEWIFGVKRKPKMLLFRPVVKGGNGYCTQGVQLSSDILFEHEKITEYLKSTGWMRIKGFIHSNQGWFKINISDRVFDLTPSSPQESNIIEIIHDQALISSLESELLQLIE